MFGRSTIRLGIGPHSSLLCVIMKFQIIQHKDLRNSTFCILFVYIHSLVKCSKQNRGITNVNIPSVIS